MAQRHAESVGRDAVHQAYGLRPDVVLMDLCLPELDGIAATRAILEEVPDTYT